MNDPKLRKYTQEEVASILSRALDQRQNGEGRISHDELLETAREIGVTTQQMETAIASELRLRAEQAVIQTKRDQERRRRRNQVLAHAAAFVVVGGALTAAGLLWLGAWVFGVIGAWGVGLAIHAWRALATRAPKDPEAQRQADTTPGR
jgi:hypothetical protein